MYRLASALLIMRTHFMLFPATNNTKTNTLVDDILVEVKRTFLTTCLLLSNPHYDPQFYEGSGLVCRCC